MGHNITGEAAATGHATDDQPRIPFADIESSFNNHYGHKALGLGDDGDQFLIIGHVEPLHVVGIARHVLHTDLDFDMTEPFTVTSVRQTHAEFTNHFDGCPRGETCPCDGDAWFGRFTDTPTAHSTPVTFVETEW